MDDLGRLMLVVGVCIAVVLYIALIAWRVHNRRDRGGPAPAGRSFARMGRAERKAAAIAGTTPVVRPDLAEAEARVLATAARLAGREPPKEPEPGESAAAESAAEDGTSMSPAASTPAEPSLFRASPDDEPAAAAAWVSTLAELLAGIHLPDSLAPLTDLAPRDGVVDRIAFISASEPAEMVGPALARELERLGFTASLDGYDTLTARRGPDTAMVVIHRDASQSYLHGKQLFPSAPPFAAVIEIWIPTR